MQLCTKKVDTTSDPTATMNFRMFPIVILLIFIIFIKFYLSKIRELFCLRILGFWDLT